MFTVLYQLKVSIIENEMISNMTHFLETQMLFIHFPPQKKKTLPQSEILRLFNILEKIH